MKTNIKTLLAGVSFMLISTVAAAQFKMSSDGRTLSNSSNSTVGKIDSDGRTISNTSNTTVLKISGNDINNASGSTIAKMSDVLNAISGAKPEAKYVALWWFIVKGNR